jgi:toxin ParE1/3/4
MKRLPVRLRPAAALDLEEIAAYIAEQSQSAEVALGFVRRIRRRCEKIGDAPRGASERHALGAGLRLVPFEKSAVIVYRVVDDSVEIVNVFYGGRDYAALLGD